MLNFSFALDEIKETKDQFVNLIPVRHHSMSNVSEDLQLATKVVKVSGNITISF